MAGKGVERPGLCFLDDFLLSPMHKVSGVDVWWQEFINVSVERILPVCCITGAYEISANIARAAAAQVPRVVIRSSNKLPIQA